MLLGKHMPPIPNTNFILYSSKEIYREVSVLGKMDQAYPTLFPLKVAICRSNYLKTLKSEAGRLGRRPEFKVPLNQG